jgi:Fic/DOC family
MSDWDADGAQLHTNLRRLLSVVRRDAFAREVPAVAMARSWHQAMMQGLIPPRPEYVGRFGGEPGLEHLGVRVGHHHGVPSDQVASALASFEARLRRAVVRLDQLIEPDQDLSADQVAAVIELCAWVHSGWIRIHPFANGNGRTARLWANSIALRYGLPAFVRLRPRPDGDYDAAAAEAMTGRWQEATRVFLSLYREAIRQ